MNVNLLTIDGLSATSLQPRTRMANKADGDSPLALGEVQGPAGKPGLASGESRGGRGESVLTTASASGADKSQSYNITANTQETDQKPLPRCCLGTARRGGGFESILKRRLVSDESSDENGDGEVAAKPQELVTGDKTEQALTAFQGIAVSAEQKQSIADGKATSNQPTQAVPGALTKADNLSSIETQAAGGNMGGVQRSVSQQTQATSAGGSQTVPSTAAKITDAQQGQQQSEASSNVDTEQTRGNSEMASPRSADNTVKMNVSENQSQDGSGKPAESANQNNHSGDAQSIDLPSQSGVVQSQTAALSAVT